MDRQRKYRSVFCIVFHGRLWVGSLNSGIMIPMAGTVVFDTTHTYSVCSFALTYYEWNPFMIYIFRPQFTTLCTLFLNPTSPHHLGQNSKALLAFLIFNHLPSPKEIGLRVPLLSLDPLFSAFPFTRITNAPSHLITFISRSPSKHHTAIVPYLARKKYILIYAESHTTVSLASGVETIKCNRSLEGLSAG